MNNPPTAPNTDFEKLLAAELSRIIADHSTDTSQALVDRLSKALDVTPTQIAAALLFLEPSTRAACIKNYSSQQVARNPLPANEPVITEPLLKKLTSILKPSDIKPEKLKMVRYRLEVGLKHQVSIEDIKEVLINESGVERGKIGYTDMRSYYTLIDLPNGMPPDIFQHLQSVEIKKQMLQIKRVNNSRKRHWHRRKGGTKNQNPENGQDSNQV